MKQQPSSAATGRRSRRIWAIIACSLGGALGLTTLMLLLQGYAWAETTSESGGIFYNLSWLARHLVHTLFQTPWGAIGALIGAAAGWVALRRPHRCLPPQPQCPLHPLSPR